MSQFVLPNLFAHQFPVLTSGLDLQRQFRYLFVLASKGSQVSACHRF